MKTAAVLAALLMLAACGGAPSASPAATARASAIGACRLPVGRPQFSVGNPFLATGFEGGFLQLPGGRYSSDAGGAVSLTSAGGRGPSVYSTAAQPVLRGSDAVLGPPGRAGMAYDAAAARWLPVPESSVSPDGTRYAYVDEVVATPLNASRVHVVDVRTATERVFVFPGPDLAQASQWLAGVVAFADQGVYLSLYGSNQGSGPDTGKLWLLDPDQGTIRKVSDEAGSLSPYPWVVHGTYAWTLLPTAGAASTVPNRLVRLDLHTAQLVDWWTDSGYEPVSSPGAVTELSVMGMDGLGDPIVEGSGETGDGGNYARVVDVWVITSQNHAERLDVSAANVGAGASTLTWDGVATDRIGTWIAVDNHLFLYRTGGSFVEVATGAYAPSGPCA